MPSGIVKVSSPSAVVPTIVSCTTPVLLMENEDTVPVTSSRTVSGGSGGGGGDGGEGVPFWLQQVYQFQAVKTLSKTQGAGGGILGKAAEDKPKNDDIWKQKLRTNFK